MVGANDNSEKYLVRALPRARASADKSISLALAYVRLTDRYEIKSITNSAFYRETG
jgi:hypothetical protein